MKIVLAGYLVGQGGIQTHFKWLALALAEAGHQILILSLGTPPRSSDRERSDSLMRDHEITVLYVYESNVKQRTSIAASYYVFTQLRAFQPDYYLACGTGYNLFIPAILSRKCKGLVFHEVMAGISGNWRDSRWLARYFFDRVIAQATPVAANFKRAFGWTETVDVLPAFPEPLEKTAHLRSATRHTVPKGRGRAALFSRLAPHKQAFWLVKQWPKLAGWLSELHIFGSGPEEELIRAFITENGLDDQVFCHGSYPAGQEYAELLSSFDLTLLPTIGAEGAPLVLLESMACGVPFVAFDVGGIIDYSNPDCEICSAQDTSSFLLSVKRLISRLEEGDLDQGRLQKFYLDHFSFDRLKARWLDTLLINHRDREARS